MNHFLSSICTLAIICFTCSASAQIVFTKQTTPTTRELKAIAFADANTGYSCGDSGTVIKTTDGGLNWTSLNTNTQNNLWDLKIIPGSNGSKVIAAGNNNTIIKSTDGGQTWTAQTVPFQAGSFVFGIYCLDSLNYYACGGDYATFSGAILRTTNGGNTWTVKAIPGSIFLDKIFMTSDNNGYTVGTNTSFSDGSIQKISAGPVSNTSKTSADLITNIWCKSEQKIVAIGLNGQILKSDDGGANWSNQSVNNINLYGIQFIDTQNGFICGGSSMGNSILQTTDGGTNWQPITYNFNGTLQALCVTGNSIYIAGDAGTIIKGTHQIVSGIDPIHKIAFTLFPNPAVSVLNIHAPVSGNYRIILQNIYGQVLLAEEKNGSAQINLSHFKTGTYSVSVISDGYQSTQKVVISR